MRRHAVSTGRPERMLGVIVLLQTLTLAIAGPATSTEYLPLRVADAEGLFAHEGLSVVVKTTRAEPGAAEALVQGQADLVATSLDAMLRFGPRSSSQSPRLVLGLTAAPPTALLVSTSPAARSRAGRIRAGRAGRRAAHRHRAARGARRQARQARRRPPRRLRGAARERARPVPAGRRGQRRAGEADVRVDPHASAVARHEPGALAGGDPAPRAAAARRQRAGGPLTATPNEVSRRAVSSRGSPTTLLNEPSRPATSAPPRPWIA